MTESKQELVFSVTTVAAYDPFRTQLAELKEGNSKAVFDYRDPKGNKEARSHIYKLRQTKAAVDKVRKAEKEASLNYGRLVDSQAKEIVQEIEEMIEVHEKPIREIEKEEEDRIAGHRAAIAKLESFLNSPDLGATSDLAIVNRDAFRLLEPDEKFEEFTAEALRTYKSVLERFEIEIDKLSKREAEQAELEKLRKEAAEREQRDRDERIAREAAENARIAAEQAAAAERKKLADEQARKDAEAKAAIERAEREKVEAENARIRQEQQARDAAARLSRIASPQLPRQRPISKLPLRLSAAALSKKSYASSKKQNSEKRTRLMQRRLIMRLCMI